MKVLYVEDNPANVFLVKRVARMGNHEIINYIDGGQALKKYDEINPDLVLMDIQLAGDKSGLDVVRELRGRGVKTTIIAVTAYAMVGDKERCIEAGCDDYLAKPLPIPRLVEIFEMHSKRVAAEALKAAPVAVAEATASEAAKVEPAPVVIVEAPKADAAPVVIIETPKTETAPVMEAAKTEAASIVEAAKAEAAAIVEAAKAEAAKTEAAKTEAAKTEAAKTEAAPKAEAVPAAVEAPKADTAPAVEAPKVEATPLVEKARTATAPLTEPVVEPKASEETKAADTKKETEQKPETSSN